mgnify:CR=1 FL=1
MFWSCDLSGGDSFYSLDLEGDIGFMLGELFLSFLFVGRDLCDKCERERAGEGQCSDAFGGMLEAWDFRTVSSLGEIFACCWN